MNDFIKRAINYGINNGLNIPELALFLLNGRCTHEEYLSFCTYFKNNEHLNKYYAMRG